MLKIAYQVFEDEACDVSPNTLPRPSAPMAGRGHKRPGRLYFEGRHPAVFFTAG